MPMIDIVYQSESVYSGFISLVKVKKNLVLLLPMFTTSPEHERNHS